MTLHICIEKIQRHIRVEHVFIRHLFGKAVVIIPWTHFLQQIIHRNRFRQRPFRLVVTDHPAYFFRTETNDAVEFRIHADVHPDIESAGHIVHRDGTDTSDKQTVDRRIRSGGSRFDDIEKLTDETFAMGRLAITFCAISGKQGIGEVVVLVNQKIDARIIVTCKKTVQRRKHDAWIGFVTINQFPYTVSYYILMVDQEILYYHATVFSEFPFHLIGISTDFRKIKSEYQVFIMCFRRVLPDI